MRQRARRYVVPPQVNSALERVLGAPVDTVVVIEHSLYARVHLNMTATTRPNRILLSMSGAHFIAQHEMLLHEYFHVVHQWRPGHLTRCRYLLESARCGYWDNRYEREAREFAAGAVDRYRRCLHAACGGETV